jgi:hypothetical protein
MGTEVASSAPHFLHSGLSLSPIKWRCLYRVLCPVRSPVTTLDCSLLRDKNLALVSRLGPEINSRTCRWEGPRSCHRLWCWFTSQRPILLLRSRFETPRAGSGPTNPLAEPKVCVTDWLKSPMRAHKGSVTLQHGSMLTRDTGILTFCRQCNRFLFKIN